MLLLCLGRSIHVLALRRLLNTSDRIRRTLLLLLMIIERLLGHALIMRLKLGIGIALLLLLTSILLTLLTRRGLAGPFAGPIVGLCLIASSQPTARRTEAATLIQIVAAIFIVAANIPLLAALVAVAVVAADDALPLRFRGDGADAAVVLASSSIGRSSRLRVISPICSCATTTSIILLSARERRGGLVDHPGNIAAHDNLFGSGKIVKVPWLDQTKLPVEISMCRFSIKSQKDTSDYCTMPRAQPRS